MVSRQEAVLVFTALVLLAYLRVAWASGDIWERVPVQWDLQGNESLSLPLAAAVLLLPALFAALVRAPRFQSAWGDLVLLVAQARICFPHAVSLHLVLACVSLVTARWKLLGLAGAALAYGGDWVACLALLLASGVESALAPRCSARKQPNKAKRE